MAIDQRRADTDEKLSSSPMIRPTMRAGIETSADWLQTPDRCQRRFPRRPTHRRSRMQSCHEVEHMNSLGQRGADRQMQVLYIGEPKDSRLRGVLDAQIQIGKAPQNGIQHHPVFPQIFFALE